MKRVAEYRYIRVQRRKYILVIVFSFLLTITGIIVTDYYNNKIVSDENRLNIVQMENKKNNVLKISILNKDVNIHYGNIYKDFEQIRKEIEGFKNRILK